MNNIINILIFLSIAINCNKVYSQPILKNEHNFTDSSYENSLNSVLNHNPQMTSLNAEWYFRGWHPTPFGPEVHAFIDRDTMIGNKYCTIMSLEIAHTYIPGSDIIFYEENHQVYFFQDNQFYRLFDFSSNLQIGDTIEYYIPNNGNLYDFSSGQGLMQEIENHIF